MSNKLLKFLFLFICLACVLTSFCRVWHAYVHPENTCNCTQRSPVQIDTSENRKERLTATCNDPSIVRLTKIPKGRQLRVQSRILVDHTHNLAYCNVPKIGSSFWYSVFAILASNLSEKVTSPYEMWQRYGGDLQRHAPVKYLSQVPPGEKQRLLNDSLMFLFVRDPYRRLYSAYTDKLLMNNYYYWLRTGRTIVRHLRPSPKMKSQRCGHDVTFEEFLTFFVISETSEKIFRSDHHWTPIYKLCAPCHYPYHIIGKMETFLHDTNAILKSRKLTSAIEIDQHEQDHVLANMMQTISNFLNSSLSMSMKACVNLPHDVDRLWDVFKAKGYIKSETRSPIIHEKLSSNNTVTLKRFLFDKVCKAYRAQYYPGSRIDYSNTILAKAYQNIPLNILYQVRDILLPDFHLFDYDPEPTRLFQNIS